MEIYKLGTRWGSGQPNFYEMIKRREIIIMASNTANPNVGDIIVIADGYTVLAIAKVLEELRPVTEDTSLEEDFDANKIDYEDWVTFASAEWYELTKEEQFQYELQQGISVIRRDDIREKVIYLFNTYLGKNQEPLLVIEDENKGTEVSQPFNPKDIKVEVKQLSLDSIIKRLKTSRINLEAEYQRLADLWDDVRKSRLIESILLQLPLPVFYFDGTDDESWEVIDGLQRLSTIYHFVLGHPEKGKLALEGLEFLTDLNEKTFDRLPPGLKTRIEEANITVYLLRPGTPEDVKFNLFKRINTGGLILTPPEIRHALNKGIPAKYVWELARNPSFITATDNSIPSKRMEDRDFIIRFISFYLFGYANYQPDLDTFLNKGMRAIKTLSEEEREDMKTAFVASMNLSYDLFEKDAFRKKYGINDNRKKPINKALFEVVSVCFAKLQPYQVQRLLVNKKRFIVRFYNLFNTQQFVNAISISTGDRKNVNFRYTTIEQLIDDILKP